MTITSWLQNWYLEACNGTWEHSHGIRIDTLDNPGWHVQIDLAGTRYANVAAREIRLENNLTDWLRCSLQGQEFNGYGDPRKLEKIIEVFREWLLGEKMN